MNQSYPDRWHPVYMIQDALEAMGIRTEFARDARTLNCWGLIFPDFDNRVFVWLVDNRLPWERETEDPAAKELLNRGALVAHTQKPDAERVGGHWLPLAASPGFQPVSVAKTADVAFVGYVRDEGRARLLADVGKKFKLSVNQGVFGKQANEAYCGARVGLNIPSQYGQPYCYDINMRVFEIAACGVPLVTNALPELAELGFVNGQTCFAYKPYPDASITDAVQQALVHSEVGQAGYELVQKYHTYRARAVRVSEWLSA